MKVYNIIMSKKSASKKRRKYRAVRSISPQKSYKNFKRKASKTVLWLLIVLFLSYPLIIAPVIALSTGQVKNFAINETPYIHSNSSSNISSILVVELDKQDKAKAITLFVVNDEISELYIFNIPSDFHFYDYSNSFDIKFLSIQQLIYGGSKNFSNKYKFLMWDLSESIGFPVETLVLYHSDTDINKANFDLKNMDIKKAYHDDIIDDSVLSSISLIQNLNYKNLIINPFEFANLLNHITTNEDEIILLKQILKFNAYLKNYRGITIVDLHNEWGKESIYNSLGDEIFILNTSNLDMYIQQNIKNLADINILKERLTVEVYNGSDIPSLAFRYARKISNTGIPVLRYENAPDVVEKTTVYMSDKNTFKSWTYKQIKNSLGLSNKDIVVIYDRPNWITTADIVVVLGKNINKKQ